MDIMMMDKYRKLQTVYQLERNIARQNMHNAMSPISAISGYLELLNRSLFQEADKERIEDYRKKIHHGITELHQILDQLNEIYDEEYINGYSERNSNVDLNWLVRELCNQKASSTSGIRAVCSSKPIHVNTNLFKIKLILANLINYAERIGSEGVVQVEASAVNNQAVIAIHFQAGDSKQKELRQLLNSDTVDDHPEENNSFNRGLLSCVKLAEQLKGEINMEKNRMRECTSLYLAIPLFEEQMTA